MAEFVIEQLKRQLDSEVQSPNLTILPRDFYSKLSAYSQKLKRSAGPGNSEVSIRLISAQVHMMESMTRDLLLLRTAKATRLRTYLQLLPEERYVCSAQGRFSRRFETFILSVSGGRPSFFEFAQRSESERCVTVRFTKQVGELVGLDLRRYGPFEVDDVASIPAASADILVSGGDAVEVNTREDS